MAHERSGSAEQDLAEALDRLAAGKPTHAVLKKLATRGKLRINCSTVAREARHSRTLIGHEHCAYPAIRMRVLEYMKPVAQPRDSATVITHLREQVAELRLLLKNAQEQVAIHLFKRQKAEQEAARWRRAYDRVVRKINTDQSRAEVIPLHSLAPDDNSGPQ